MLTCPECKNLVEADALFCDRCGYPLKPQSGEAPLSHAESESRVSFGQATGSTPAGGAAAQPGTCAACGFVNIPGEMFCQSCGVQLPPAASAPPSPLRGTANLNADTAFEVADPASSLEEIGAGASDLASFPRTDEPVGRLDVKNRGDEVLFSLQAGEFIIGRSDPILAIYPDLDTTPFGGEQTGVSRRHARISSEGGVLYIQDLNSTNFTYLNGRRLEPGRRYPLNDGDEIQMGLLMMVFHPLQG